MVYKLTFAMEVWMPLDDDKVMSALLAMADRMDQVLWVADAGANRVLYVNDAYERVFGRPRAWALDHSPRQAKAVHPDDREAFVAAIAASEEREVDIEYRMVLPNGEVRRLATRGFRVHVPGLDRLLLAGITRDVTEARQAEAALRESEARFRELAENVPHIVFRIRTADPWAIEYISPAVERALGVAPEELYADRELLLAMVHEDDREDLVARLKGLEPPTPTVMRFRHRDGRAVWLEQDSVRVEDRDGKPIGVDGVARDVTERVRSADLALRLDVTRALAESQTLDEAAPRLLEAVAVRAGWAVTQLWLADADDGRLRCNATWSEPERAAAPLHAPEASFGPGDGCIGQVYASGEPLWVTELQPDMSPLADAAVDVGLRSMLLKPVRGPREVLGVLACYSTSPRPRRRDELTSLAGAAREIGQYVSRERAEAALRDARRTLESVVAHVPGMAYRARPTPSRPFDLVSDGALGLTGYSPAMLTGADAMAFGDLIAEHDRETVWSDISRAVAERRPYQCEYRLHGADGTEKWVLDQGTGAFDASGQLTQLQGFVADITGRRRLESQLHQAQKMEAVGQLAGGVAHDFNNMLMAMTFAADFLHEGLRAGDPLRGDVEEIQRAIDRAAGLTRQLLAFSRKQVLRPEVLSLNDVVSRMGTMLRRVLGEDVEVVTTLDPGLVPVKVDPGQVEQVLLNLAVNARDAMPGGGRLAIETRNATHDEDGREGAYAVVVVSDNGCGMDEATRARIFEPFFTTKGVGRGTGLGLATVYGIVKQSGGHIHVYSEPGRGATFRIFLPKTSEAARAATSSEVQSPQSGSETVLLVEDEDPVRAAARRVLQGRGYIVLEARGPSEAMLLSERYSGPIHLLLSDVVMPGMSGPDLAARLVDRRPELLVLFMSGFTEHAALASGVLAPSSAFLEKPFAPSVLARRVRELLDRRQG